MVEDGDLFMIYGASGNHTQLSQRNRVIGFLQVDARPVMDTDKASEAGMERKRANGWLGKWCYGLPERRAWRVNEPILLQLKRIAPETYRPDAGQAIAVWCPALTDAETERAMKIRVTEVPVFGEPALAADVVSNEAFGNVFRPSRAFPGTAGERTSLYEDGDTSVYLARFDGDGHALLKRPKAINDKSVVMKIGVSGDTSRRIKQLNAGIPPAAKGKWIDGLISQPFPDRRTAESVEQKFKEAAEVGLESLGKEFFWGDWTSAMLIFAALPGASRF